MNGRISKKFRKDAFKEGLNLKSTSGSEYIKERKAEHNRRGKPNPPIPQLSKRQQRIKDYEIQE